MTHWFPPCPRVCLFVCLSAACLPSMSDREEETQVDVPRDGIEAVFMCKRSIALGIQELVNSWIATNREILKLGHVACEVREKRETREVFVSIHNWPGWMGAEVPCLSIWQMCSGYRGAVKSILVEADPAIVSKACTPEEGRFSAELVAISRKVKDARRAASVGAESRISGGARDGTTEEILEQDGVMDRIRAVFGCDIRKGVPHNMVLLIGLPDESAVVSFGKGVMRQGGVWTQMILLLIVMYTLMWCAFVSDLALDPWSMIPSDGLLVLGMSWLKGCAVLSYLPGLHA